METAPYDLITVDDSAAVARSLDRLGILDAGERVDALARAGEGNMNLVIRVRTDRRSLILKQSRPWVEKYPHIAAPADRILSEIEFYRLISVHESIRSCMPRMLGADERCRILVLEDLGQASDFSDLYQSQSVESLPLREAIDWLVQLHGVAMDSGCSADLGNRLLLELNHAHIFVIPLENPSAIPLDQVCPGLENLAVRVRGDSTVKAAARRLGSVYLDGGDHLLHGDFYPGSWLRTTERLRIIDPEFTFAGPVEFDLGVLAAHRLLVGGTEDSTDVVASYYAASGGRQIDRSLLNGFAALEIIRRLIGVAQLPLSVDLQRRTDMIEVAGRWLEA